MLAKLALKFTYLNPTKYDFGSFFWSQLCFKIKNAYTGLQLKYNTWINEPSHNVHDDK